MSDPALNSGSISSIVDLARKAADVQIVKLPGNHGWFGLREPNGAFDIEWQEPDFKSHELENPIALREFLKSEVGTVTAAVAAAAAEDSGNNPVDVNTHGWDRPATFVGNSEVVTVLDLDDRRQVAKCPLTVSEPFEWLMNPPGKLSQQELIDELRITFRGCLPNDGHLLKLLRKLRFEEGSIVVGDVNHTNATLGKTVNAAVTGEGSPVPEEITLDVQVFENFHHRQFVACAIQVFAFDQKFRLRPFPGEIRRAQEAAIDAVAESLSGEGLPPVFRGQP